MDAQRESNTFGEPMGYPKVVAMIQWFSLVCMIIRECAELARFLFGQ